MKLRIFQIKLKIVVKSVNNILENRIVNLEKQLLKNEQYGRGNNSEISGISNDILDQDIEESIKICQDSNINMSPMDIEGCLLFIRAVSVTWSAFHPCGFFLFFCYDSIFFFLNKKLFWHPCFILRNLG